MTNELRTDGIVYEKILDLIMKLVNEEEFDISLEIIQAEIIAEAIAEMVKLEFQNKLFTLQEQIIDVMSKE
jgi:hypothetical protein